MVLAPYAAVHERDVTQGPGDARPTARKIVEDQGLIGKLQGKVMLVTGGSSGIGIETVRALHATGADVYMTARSIEKGRPVQEDIQSDNGPGKVEIIEMELDSLASVKKAAETFLSKSKTLNVLINNAGIMACDESKTKDGFENQFGTNHLGHFYLFELLKPALLAGSTPEFNSRVISVSSSGHRNNQIQFDDFHFSKTIKYDPWKAYGQSKLANVYFANEIDRRYGSKGLHALSLHPGGILTNLSRHLDPKFFDGAKKAFANSFKSPEQGAATTVWAAVAKEWEGTGGKYLEDVQEAVPAEMGPNQDPGRKGHAPYAYDEAAEKRLWVESLKMVGLEDDA